MISTLLTFFFLFPCNISFHMNRLFLLLNEPGLAAYLFFFLENLSHQGSFILPLAVALSKLMSSHRLFKKFVILYNTYKKRVWRLRGLWVSFSKTVSLLPQPWLLCPCCLLHFLCSAGRQQQIFLFQITLFTHSLSILVTYRFAARWLQLSIQHLFFILFQL